MSNTFGDNINASTTFLYNLFDYCQSQPDSFSVHFGRSVKLAKSTEQFFKVFLSDSSPSVFNMYYKAAYLSIITGFYVYRAL